MNNSQIFQLELEGPNIYISNGETLSSAALNDPKLFKGVHGQHSKNPILTETS
jgi:hypothetical protein